MKKKNILNLIKYHMEKNENGFRTEAYEIASYFDKKGDYQLSEYVMALLSDANTFIPQIDENEMAYFNKIPATTNSLPLPEIIMDDVVGIINAINHNVGINKFLFEGHPGTGKTETVKQISKILNRELFAVEFDSVIDSKLGQTSKNIIRVFDEIRSFANPRGVVVLFDEFDSIALDRINSNDLREMGRATSTILKELDKLPEDVVLIATTNLYKEFDRAIIRRFDTVINFDRYSRGELIDISESILNDHLIKFKNAGRNKRLFRKIIDTYEDIPYPGDLKNLIKTSLAFSSPSNEYDYLKILYKNINNKIKTAEEFKNDGYTLREIEILTGISKSKVSRELKVNRNE